MRNSPFKEGSANNSQTFLKMDVHVVHLQLFCYPLYLVFTLLWSRSFCPGVNQQTAGSLFWRTAAFFLWNVFNYNTRKMASVCRRLFTEHEVTIVLHQWRSEESFQTSHTNLCGVLKKSLCTTCCSTSWTAALVQQFSTFLDIYLALWIIGTFLKF